jgi:hypothetical protein
VNWPSSLFSGAELFASVSFHALRIGIDRFKNKFTQKYRLARAFVRFRIQRFRLNSDASTTISIEVQKVFEILQCEDQH